MRLENGEDLNKWLKGQGIADRRQEAAASAFRDGVVSVMKKTRDLWGDVLTFPI